MGTPVIITGMHRSGTSLLANLLLEAGVAIGDDLAAATSFNAKGHFEDVEFLKLHRQAMGGGDPEILYTASADDILPTPPEFIERSQALIAERAEVPLWGFKDPRTTLYLDYWAGLLPDAYFVLIYRSPEYVVNSLRRRRDPPLFDHSRGPGKEKYLWKRAADMWASYNQRLLRFLEKHSQRSLLLKADLLADDFPKLLSFMAKEWGLPVTDCDAASVVDPSLMRSHVPPVLRWKTQRRRSVRQTLRALDEAYQRHRRW